MIGMVNPVVPEKANDILLGEGITKVNTDKIGATKGGSRLEVDKKILDIKFDGAYGSVKGLRKPEIHIARLTINFLKITYVNLAYGLNADIVSGQDSKGQYRDINFRLDFKASDVVNKVSFEGFKHDGTPCIIILENVLNLGDIGFEFKEKGEVILPVTYTGFYLYNAPTTPPYEINDYYPTA
ncbi:MAG: hypothetical protein EH224_10115 [Calditrichaeota bacterium]|nr:MAG: hypothetical protein EH224_10115 [Calditrichota bacterium]